MIFIPIGGKTQPIKTLGLILKWKKDQKIEKKNIISDIIKRTIPLNIPNWTFLVWKPFIDSLLTVKNQSNKINKNKKELIFIKKELLSKWK